MFDVAASFGCWRVAVTGSAFDDPNVPNDEGIIGTFRDQATGIGRAQEVIMDTYGMDLFDRDAVYADGEQGTFEEPICILSHTNHRVVGVSYPVRGALGLTAASFAACCRYQRWTHPRLLRLVLQEDSEVRWFTLMDGYKAFDPVSCNFFALRTVPIEEMDEFVRSAEWDEHKDRYQRPGVVPGAAAAHH